jgi:AcrR family transcriptional regulator
MGQVSPASTRQRARARARRSATEQAILDATEALLAERSFHELTVEDVMTSTGMTRTAFYRYFPDLEAVLLRRLSEIGDELREAADRWLDPEADAEGGLMDAGRALAEVYQRHGRLLLAYTDAASSSPDLAAAWRAMVQTFVEPALQRIVSLCTIPHPEQVTQALVGMLERYLVETYGRGPEVPIDVAAETLAFIWRRTLFGS